ncbi:MAG TPA: phosphoenolpyruvate--protein phosphotransferase [Elusimicrobiota bacterium]|nr:phosphoenolpyruvate--protein phosphotransferase [Elusimicrobiota bacterium]HNA60672.1 phosphoenolpyruvate--protein phosphotransferase [Elusimicrobiota bacterium]HNG44544.1 phosphoenolpyruvate--protein phosphotransferase [Elusimicrobiota bacterium]
MNTELDPKVFKGISASPGIAIGRAFVLEDMDLAVGRWQVPPEAVKAEVSRFRQAVADTRKEMLTTQQKILKLLGKTHARLIEAYILILEDPLIAKDVVKNISQNRVNAEYALSEAIAGAVKALESATDEYFRERRHDVLDVGRKILLHLLGHEPQSLDDLKEPSVIVARNLTPSDTIHMQTKFAEGFATDIGGRTSHTAILANSMGIPAVVGLHDISRHVRPGDMLIVDGHTGTVVINPSPDLVDNYRRERDIRLAEKRDLEGLRDQPAQSTDGRRLTLAANIDSPTEMKGVLSNGAEGVGLLRTEFLYLNRAALPTEEDHLQFYTRVAQSVLPYPVIIRTVDIGGDKLVDLGFAHLSKSEPNPFLGLRGIRLSLKHHELFRTQLRAILRASAVGKVKVMFPMVSGLEEFRAGRKILAECMEELRRENKPFDEKMEVGLMIEVPSAALVVDHLAQEADFMSVGTNDLIQYTLAVDRVNDEVAHLYEPLHPAILRLLSQTVKAAHAAGKWVGMCGEMASDLDVTPILLGLEFDELSVSAGLVPKVKKMIRDLSFTDCQALAQEVLKDPTRDNVQRLLRQFQKR